MKESTVIHIPHASVYIPEKHLCSFDRIKLQHEVNVMTDWFCDELFDCGRERIVFPVSRLVCDVERFRDDRLEIMSELGMGAVYLNCSDMSPLRQLLEGERESILREWYDVHHQSFTDTVSLKLEKYGKCLIVDAHSFYPSPLPYELDRDTNRPDFCIGTCPCHTPEAATEALRSMLTEYSYTVKINSPFAGTIVPMKYYEKDKRVVSVMIEVNRRLYMETPGIKNGSFLKIKKLLGECVELLEGKI